ncbi:MAG: MFS transporter [Bacteroidales bacterium]|nr:MFS transporter [Bacteroidales bacterium]
MAKTEKGYSRPLVATAACLGCAFFGVTMFFWGTMKVSLEGIIDGIQNLTWILTLGIIAGTIICGIIMDRYGYKALLISASLALSLGLFGFIFCYELWQLVLSSFLIGAGGGILNSETIAIISDIYGDNLRGTMLSILGASYCVGSLLWTVICSVWLNDPMIPMKWSAAVIGVLSLAFIFISFPKAKLTKADKFSLIDSLKLFKYHILAIAGFLFFFQGVLERISQTYSAAYYEDGIGKEMAVTSLIFMTVGMAVGRFTLPVCLKVGGRKVSMFLFLAIAFIGALLQFLMPASLIGAFVSMTLLGIGIGVTAPVVFDYLGQVFKKHSGAAVSLSVIVAQIGMLLGDFLVGRMFITSSVEAGPPKYFPIVMCAMVVAVCIAFPFVAKSSDNAKNKNLDL